MTSSAGQGWRAKAVRSLVTLRVTIVLPAHIIIGRVWRSTTEQNARVRRFYRTRSKICPILYFGAFSTAYASLSNNKGGILKLKVGVSFKKAKIKAAKIGVNVFEIQLRSGEVESN